MASFEKLKEGDKLSETQYYSVVQIVNNKVQLMNDHDRELVVVDKTYVENYITTANQFESTEEITRTDAAAKFIATPWTVMTVNFNKQVDEKVAKEQLYELYANKGGKMLSEADYKKKVNSVLKSVITGEERTMVGRHFGSKDDF